MTFIPAVFPRIAAYRREADAVHHAREVVCLEKIDGSNTRVGVPRDLHRADQLVVGGRSLLEGDEGFCQPELRAGFVAGVRFDALRDVARALPDHLTLYGETCGRGIQATGFIYGPSAHFVLFAAAVGDAWLGWSHALDLVDDAGSARRLPSLCELAVQTGLTLAPCLYRGAPDPERFDALLDRPSAHAAARGSSSRPADATHEGVVIWSDPALRDGAGRLLVAKHKHPNRREALDEAPGGDEAAEGFAARVVNGERLAHARQHLEEGGRWGCPRDERIDRLVRRVVQDVAREEPAYARQIARHTKAVVRAALEARARALAEHEADR